MTIGVGPTMFTQMLCYLAMFRNVLGNVITGAFFSSQTYKLNQNYIQKLSARMDAKDLQYYMASLYNQSIKTGAAASDAGISTSKTLYARISREAILLAGRDLFGWVALFGLVVISAIAIQCRLVNNIRY